MHYHRPDCKHTVSKKAQHACLAQPRHGIGAQFADNPLMRDMLKPSFFA